MPPALTHKGFSSGSHNQSPVRSVAVTERASSAVDDGHIRRAKENVESGERRAVWFSSRLTWEPTATKRYVSRDADRRATIAEMTAAAGPLVRLEVSEQVARYTWTEHQRNGHMDPRVADILEAVIEFAFRKVNLDLGAFGRDPHRESRLPFPGSGWRVADP